MTLSWLTNIALIVLSVGVLVQTARLMVLFRRFKQTSLTETVSALEKATHSAQVVLDNLRTFLSVEARAQTATATSAAQMRDELGALRDELSVMVEVGNSVAERIEGAANAARLGKAPTGKAPAEMKAKPRARSAAARKAVVEAGAGV